MQAKMKAGGEDPIDAEEMTNAPENAATSGSTGTTDEMENEAETENEQEEQESEDATQASAPMKRRRRRRQLPGMQQFGPNCHPADYDCLADFQEDLLDPDFIAPIAGVPGFNPTLPMPVPQPQPLDPSACPPHMSLGDCADWLADQAEYAHLQGVQFPQMPEMPAFPPIDQSGNAPTANPQPTPQPGPQPLEANACPPFMSLGDCADWLADQAEYAHLQGVQFPQIPQMPAFPPIDQSGNTPTANPQPLSFDPNACPPHLSLGDCADWLADQAEYAHLQGGQFPQMPEIPALAPNDPSFGNPANPLLHPACDPGMTHEQCDDHIEFLTDFGLLPGFGGQAQVPDQQQTTAAAAPTTATWYYYYYTTAAPAATPAATPAFATVIAGPAQVQAAPTTQAPAAAPAAASVTTAPVAGRKRRFVDGMYPGIWDMDVPDSMNPYDMDMPDGVNPYDMDADEYMEMQAMSNMMNEVNGGRKRRFVDGMYPGIWDMDVPDSMNPYDMDMPDGMNPYDIDADEYLEMQAMRNMANEANGRKRRFVDGMYPGVWEDAMDGYYDHMSDLWDVDMPDRFRFAFRQRRQACELFYMTYSNGATSDYYRICNVNDIVPTVLDAQVCLG